MSALQSGPCPKASQAAWLILAFAHLNSPQLACLDEAGNLFVWRLALINGKIQYPSQGGDGGLEKSGWSWVCQTHRIILRLALNTLLREEILVHIRQPEGTPLNHFRRIIWCPFTPEERKTAVRRAAQRWPCCMRTG